MPATATDPVTGARMRAPGLADLELEMHRSRRTNEFLCAMSGAGLPEIQRRFRRVAGTLRATDDPLEITAGFAELQPEDTLAEPMAHADRDLIEHRWAAGDGRPDHRAR